MNEKELKEQIKRLKRDRLILLIFVITTVFIQLYNMLS